ncbi:MAG: LamG-like jellyroll fold domain-containing protein [Candidatus Krumholzibacteriia bacterium]
MNSRAIAPGLSVSAAVFVALMISAPISARAQGGDYALDFNGQDAWAHVPDSPLTGEDLAHGLTYEAWVLARPTDNDQGMILWNGNGIESSLYQLPGEGRFGFAIKFATAGWQSIEFPGALNKWQHIAGVWDRDARELRGYVNGALVGSSPIPDDAPFDNWGFDTFIGIYGDTEKDLWFDGQMSQIRMSRGARYGGDFIPPARMLPDESTLALWDMAEGIGTTLIDRSGRNLNGNIYNAEWISFLPGAPHVTDVPGDEGGRVHVEWTRSALDDTSAFSPVAAYRLQQFGNAWEDVAQLPATTAASYEADTEVEGTLVAGETPPWAIFRVIGATADDSVLHTSAADSGYSIDNLPPPAPVLSLYDSEVARVLLWQTSSVTDLKETNIYRGTEPGFPAVAPLLTTTATAYMEDHLALYYYKIQFRDIHGNFSELSNEVVGQYPTDVPATQVTRLRLHPNHPNPFNPRTTIRFDLPTAGLVRLAVYDVAGRLIRVLIDGEIPAGINEAVWDGRDATGRAMASGNYMARLKVRGELQTVRMSLVQ